MHFLIIHCLDKNKINISSAYGNIMYQIKDMHMKILYDI